MHLRCDQIILNIPHFYHFAKETNVKYIFHNDALLLRQLSCFQANITIMHGQIYHMCNMYWCSTIQVFCIIRTLFFSCLLLTSLCVTMATGSLFLLHHIRDCHLCGSSPVQIQDLFWSHFSSCFIHNANYKASHNNETIFSEVLTVDVHYTHFFHTTDAV